MKTLRLTIAVASLVFYASASNAEMTGYDYLRKQGSDLEIAKFAVAELEEGMSWSNSELRELGRAPLYCVPAHMAMSLDQPDTILRTFLKSHPETQGFSIGMLTLKAMEDTFPCPK